MGLYMFLSCKNSVLVETVVYITVKICVFPLRTSLTINSELLSYFYQTSFKRTERGF